MRGRRLVGSGGERAVAQGQPEPVAGCDGVGVGQDMAIGGLHDRIAAIERRLRAERGQARMQFLDGQRRVVDDASQSDVHATARVVDEPLMRVDHRLRARQARPVRIAVDEAAFVLDARLDAHAGAPDRLRDELHLLAYVGHDALGRVGGRGRAQVGRQVDERPVVLVADRGDDRRGARGCGAYDRLVGEADQILECAAAARDDDHVDLRIGVEAPDRGDDVGRTLRALHVRVHDLETHGRPAQVHVRDHVAFGARLRGKPIRYGMPR